MTAVDDNNQVQDAPANDKEYNFRALEARFDREIDRERQARIEAERRIEELTRARQQEPEIEEDDSEPYVDHRKLDKKLTNFGKNTQTEIQKAMEIAKESAKEEMRREMWLEKNPDFINVMKMADKLYEKDQELAETLLRMPDNFERQKLVYKSIKSLGIDKPAQKQTSIQDQIDRNQKTPYYQPSGIATAPYSNGGDFSPQGMKAAHDKMQELKARLQV